MAIKNQQIKISKNQKKYLTKKWPSDHVLKIFNQDIDLGTSKQVKKGISMLSYGTIIEILIC